MLLVLLEPVNCADSKYVFAFWIESQIFGKVRKIYKTTLTIAHIALVLAVLLVISDLIQYNQANTLIVVPGV